MLSFILRRLGQAVLVMLTVGFIAFVLFRFVGDPVLFMLEQDATPAERERVTRLLGLDQPFYVQYAKFVGRAVQGEFGQSLRQVQPVSKLLLERLPAALELSLIEDVNGVLRITRIRVRYTLKAPAAKTGEAREAMGSYQTKYPAAMSVLGCIALEDTLDVTELAE